MEHSNVKHPKNEWWEDLHSLEKQWKEMGLAIGEIKRQNAQWRDYLKAIKSRRSWIRRWFAIG